MREPGLGEGRGKQRQRQRTSYRMALPMKNPGMCGQVKNLSASAVTSFCSIPCPLRESKDDPGLRMSVAVEAKESQVLDQLWIPGIICEKDTKEVLRYPSSPLRIYTV